ncbi:hypothetical protein EMN47_02025 [Prolixibacteraceae bacterium JC049]|nr:hypothetical protein [Prolixibacteraceae bacterium JC049]
MQMFSFNSHSISKFSIYFTNKKYWQLSQPDTVVKLSLGKYFLNLKERLFDNHYNTFDDNGIPTRMKDNVPTYNFTTICSYGLANWNMYLETGNDEYIRKAELMARFVLENGVVTHYNGIVLLSNGKLCAMSHGEALSLISRVYLVKKDSELLKFAKKLLRSYHYFIDNEGIRGHFNEIEADWLEEKPCIPYKHILNGMIYSTIGLYDVAQAIPEIGSEASDLFKEAIVSLQKALPYYDRGYWSSYWYAEESKNYIASMMYHNLHVCQLKYLYRITQEDDFKCFAEKFDKYQKVMFYRIYAGFKLFVHKLMGVAE